MALAVRFGVSAKILLAYVVLLGAFAAMCAFTFDYLRRAGQDVVVRAELSQVSQNLHFAEEQLALIQQLRDIDAARKVAIHLKYATTNLLAASEALKRLIDRQGLERHRPTYAGLIDVIEKMSRLSDSGAGHEDLPQRLTKVSQELGIYRQYIVRDISQATATFEDARRAAVRRAFALGSAGVLVAIGSALLVWRTLRPLKVLRVRAREVAGGDYARRIGVRSRDEIGDLAREFDAMAEALQEREQRLIHSERLATVGRVAAQITHEIRNPLASIGLNAELLADELPADNDEGRRLLTAMSAEVDRLSEITETYLRFVRLPKLKREREDPAALIESVLEFARAELAQAGVRLDLDLRHGAPDVWVDENQIRQVLLNLVRNAREAMPHGGRLRVEVAATAAGDVRIAVADTGSGIPPEHRARVFEPFFSTKVKGTGLGLALVQQVINDHGGQIEVEAPSEGGTRFVITLPSAPAGDSPTATLEDEI